VFEFCYRFISIAKSYFGKVDEESVKNNFVLIYELVDGEIIPVVRPFARELTGQAEIVDFGYPQNSEIDTLKTYVTTESIVSTAIAAVRLIDLPRHNRYELADTVLQEESSKITTQATGPTNWRRGDVKYKKNEAFVDVVEIVNLSMSAKGTVLVTSPAPPYAMHLHRHSASCGCGRPYPDASLPFGTTRV
jgi:AP-2 complex subunit mu-1